MVPRVPSSCSIPPPAPPAEPVRVELNNRRAAMNWKCSGEEQRWRWQRSKQQREAQNATDRYTGKIRECSPRRGFGGEARCVAFCVTRASDEFPFIGPIIIDTVLPEISEFFGYVGLRV